LIFIHLQGMILFENMIIVGGTGRNIGKTTLAETLIKKLNRFGPVVGIKISNIKPEGLEFHGNHDVQSNEDFSIWEETSTNGNKDSMRFLKAGAQKSFFIQTGDAFLKDAFKEVQNHLSGKEIVVCESNSLINIMKPAVFLMVKGESNGASKAYVDELLKRADHVLNAMDLAQFESVADSMTLDEGQIKLIIQ